MTNPTACQLKPYQVCGGAAELEYNSPAEIRGEFIYTALIRSRFEAKRMGFTYSQLGYALKGKAAHHRRFKWFYADMLGYMQ